MCERLCKDLKVGGSYTIRETVDFTKRFKGHEEVVIDRFELWADGPPPQCDHKDAQLIVFKGHKYRYHPLWILNCHECPYYLSHKHNQPPIDRTAREDLRDHYSRLKESNIPLIKFHEDTNKEIQK